MRKMLLVVAALVASVPSYASSPQCEKESHDEEMAIEAKRKVLPAMVQICQSLGLVSNCDEFAIMSAGENQTDKAKWYTGTASWGQAKPPASQCRDPTPIENYGTYAGPIGTTYACLEPLEDDQITPDELTHIAALAHRLNLIQPKTLKDHRMALEVKYLVKSLGG